MTMRFVWCVLFGLSIASPAYAAGSGQTLMAQNKPTAEGEAKKSEQKPPATAKKKSPPADGSWQIFRGSDYLTLPELDKENYVTGLSDAYNWSFMGGFKKMRWFVDCSNESSSAQMAEIFDKWLEKNAIRWDEPAAKLFAFAIFESCHNAAPSQ